MLRRVAIAAAAAMVVTGCGSAQHAELDPTKAHWFAYKAQDRGAVLWPYNKKSANFIKFCAEPSPDVALERSMDVLARVQTPQGISGEAQARFNAEVVQLAGRNATLLSLREMLYRLCEMNMNGIVTAEQAAPLYERTLKVMLKLADQQLAETIKTAPISTLPAIGEALQPAAPP